MENKKKVGENTLLRDKWSGIGYDFEDAIKKFGDYLTKQPTDIKELCNMLNNVENGRFKVEDWEFYI
jgi:hypothetical protein